jgi:hypothetical protein
VGYVWTVAREVGTGEGAARSGCRAVLRGFAVLALLVGLGGCVVVTALVRDLYRRAPGFPTDEELLTDPVFAIDIPRADAQPAYGRTGTGMATSLREETTTADRHWTSSTLDRHDLFVRVLDEAHDRGVRFAQLTCGKRPLELRATGEKEVEVDHQGVWVDTIVQLIGDEPRSDVAIELRVGPGDQHRRQPTGPGAPSSGAACPDDVLLAAGGDPDATTSTTTTTSTTPTSTTSSTTTTTTATTTPSASTTQR